MIEVRRALAKDATRIRSIAVEAGIDAWSVDDYRAEIARENSFVITANESEKIVGFALARLVPGATQDYDADLYNIAVLARFRRNGIASKLIEELVLELQKRKAGNIWLEVRESNFPAIRFYEAKGFSAELTRNKFYSNPVENAIIMRLTLTHNEVVNAK